jgi:PTH1 family peptidyl-tRNA hydrolase
MAVISLVLGLGNPGPEYDGTRHNLGFETLDRLAARHRLGWRRRGAAAFTSVWRSAGRTVTLVKPWTFMNRSGEALRLFQGVPPESLLVVCDDLALPVGSLRIRESGGAGGHRGLESIIESLGTDRFPRLRMGIDSPPDAQEWSDYVLERFDPAERPEAEAMIERAADAVEAVIAGGVDAAQRRFNVRPRE